jgi:DNA-binding FadR family transcriptional regulator
MAAAGVPSRSGGRMKSQRRQVGSTSGLRLPQVEPMRLYRQIASLISDRIDEGVFPVGSLLPAERDLAERLGVSRTSVREALIALEVSGKVSIRVGHGVQILQATPRSHRVGPDADVSDTDIGPIQMMAARHLVEPRSAELAAVNRDRANLERIERAMEAQTRAKSVQSVEYRDWDRAFHIEIAKASGNAALPLIIGTLWEYRRKPMFEKIEELLMGPDRLYQTPTEHRRIFEAIAAGDRIAARSAMKAHLNAVLRAFSRGLGKK